MYDCWHFFPFKCRTLNLHSSRRSFIAAKEISISLSPRHTLKIGNKQPSTQNDKTANLMDYFAEIGIQILNSLGSRPFKVTRNNRSSELKASPPPARLPQRTSSKHTSGKFRPVALEVHRTSRKFKQICGRLCRQCWCVWTM